MNYRALATSDIVCKCDEWYDERDDCWEPAKGWIDRGALLERPGR
jgi:hypothetical protein